MDPFQHYRHLRRTKTYVEAHLSEPIGLTDVAEEIGLSPTHYSAFFSRVTGMHFNHWLRQLRVDRAKQLLCARDKPIHQISIEVGFGSLSAFERAFKRIEKTPPSVYRKSIREHYPLDLPNKS